MPLPLESTPFWLERKLPRPTQERASDCRIWAVDSGSPRKGEGVGRIWVGLWRRCGLDEAFKLVPAARGLTSSWGPSRDTFTECEPVRTCHGWRGGGGGRATRAWGVRPWDPWQWVKELACAGSESAVSWQSQQSREGKPEAGDGQMVQGRDQGRGGHWFRGRLWWSEDS